MKRYFLTTLLLVATLSLPGVCAAPDFSWGSDCSQLSLAREKWQAAANIPPPKGSESAHQQSFDSAYLRQVLAKKSFNDTAYGLLDDAMRRTRVLEETKKLYSQAIEQCKPDNTDKLRKDFGEACLELKYSISLTTALARAGVARNMAGSESSGYCFQAMESAIDTLSAAAREETDKKRLESLTKLRTEMFSVWEQAQRTRDLRLIRDFDLLRAFDESTPLRDTQRKTGPEPDK